MKQKYNQGFGYGPRILELRSQGLSYNKICKIIGCTPANVAYHCGIGQKQKTRQRKYKYKRHPYEGKLQQFHIASDRPHNSIYGLNKLKLRRILKTKRSNFMKKGQLTKCNFSVQDVVDKLGENPVCYISGRPIDINQTRSYNFDHIIPASKGGQAIIDNLGIASKDANIAKGNLSLDELFKLCKDILIYQGYKVQDPL